MLRTRVTAAVGGAFLLAATLLLGAPASSLAGSAAATAPEQLAFVRGGDIWIAGVDGSAQQQLTDTAAADSQPAWSPDGKRIAFLRGPRQLWIMNANGRGARRIPFPLGLRQMPGTAHKKVAYSIGAVTWLPSGRDLVVAAHAFSSYPDMAGGLNKTQLFLVHPNGQRRRRAGRLIYGYPQRVSCRPDGARITVSLYYRMGYSGVWTLTRSTGRYSESFPRHYLGHAAWSPDGATMACERSDDQTYIRYSAQLVAMNVKTRSMTPLLAVDRGLEWPYLYAAWSPTGDRLACSIGEHQGTYPDYLPPERDIEIVDAATKTSQSILRDADEPDWRPAVATTAPSTAAAAAQAAAAAAAPAAAASAVPRVTVVKGKPVTARRLAHAVKLPNGQLSSFTFTLRRSNGAKVKGFAVSSTRYYGDFNLEGDSRVRRGAAYRIYRRHPGSCVGGKLAFRPYRAHGKTYRVLVKVQYSIVGE